MKGLRSAASSARTTAVFVTLSILAFGSTAAGPFDPDLTDRERPFNGGQNTPTNRPPVINGSPPATASVGNAYVFTPSAVDVDNDALNFSILNLPAWASFDPRSGRLAGTPGPEHVGTYTGIQVSVSDGQARSSLPVFGIQVDAMGNGTVTLSWTAPTTNEDGSWLTNLAGYRIYWGPSTGTYPNSVTIDNPGLTTYVLEGLPAGTYEFVATSFNTHGTESEFSNAVRRTIQ